MRVISWNIQQGGGQRTAAIAEHLDSWGPDVVSLCEFRGTPRSISLAQSLANQGLAHQLTTVDPDEPRKYAILLASRHRLEQIQSAECPAAQRLITARVCGQHEITVVSAQVPNRDSGIKYSFHEAVLDAIRDQADRPAVLLGDMNTGLPKLDEATAFFNKREAEWMHSVEETGFADAFRYLNGDATVYSYHDRRSNNGFRLDHAFVSKGLVGRVESVEYRWGRDSSGRLASDHAAVILDLED